MTPVAHGRCESCHAPNTPGWRVCPDCGHDRMVDPKPVDLMAALEDSLRSTREDLERWETIKTSATLSVLPNAPVVIARIVWDGVPYTGSGPTSNAALSDLCGQIDERDGHA